MAGSNVFRLFFAINLTASSLLVLLDVMYYCWTPHICIYIATRSCGILGRHRHSNMSQITSVFLDVTKSFPVTIGLDALWSIYLHKWKVFTFHGQEFRIWLPSQTLFTYKHIKTKHAHDIVCLFTLKESKTDVSEPKIQNSCLVNYYYHALSKSSFSKYEGLSHFHIGP